MSYILSVYLFVAFGRASAFSEAGYSYHKLWGDAFRWPIYIARWIRRWLQENKNGY